MEHPPCLFTGTHITHPTANKGNMAKDIEEVQNKYLCSICHKKEVFIFLLNQLSSVCFEHITAWFLASGLHPINTKTIALYKIAPSIAITSTESQDISSSCSVAKVTPLHTEDSYSPAQCSKGKKERVNLHMEGVTLLNEEVMEYQRQQEEQKKAAKKGRKRSKSRSKQVVTRRTGEVQTKGQLRFATSTSMCSGTLFGMDLYYRQCLLFFSPDLYCCSVSC